MFVVNGWSLCIYAKFYEKLVIAPWHIHVRVCIRWWEILIFRKFHVCYQMVDSYANFKVFKNLLELQKIVAWKTNCRKFCFVKEMFLWSYPNYCSLSRQGARNIFNSLHKVWRRLVVKLLKWLLKYTTLVNIRYSCSTSDWKKKQQNKTNSN